MPLKDSNCRSRYIINKFIFISEYQSDSNNLKTIKDHLVTLCLSCDFLDSKCADTRLDSLIISCVPWREYSLSVLFGSRYVGDSNRRYSGGDGIRTHDHLRVRQVS